MWLGCGHSPSSSSRACLNEQPSAAASKPRPLERTAAAFVDDGVPFVLCGVSLRLPTPRRRQAGLGGATAAVVADCRGHCTSHVGRSPLRPRKSRRRIRAAADAIVIVVGGALLREPWRRGFDRQQRKLRKLLRRAAKEADAAAGTELPEAVPLPLPPSAPALADPGIATTSLLQDQEAVPTSLWRQATVLRGQCVPVDDSAYIPVPGTVLQEQLRQRLLQAQPSRSSHWDAFCSRLRLAVQEDGELEQLRDTLRTAYQPWDPALSRWAKPSTTAAMDETRFGRAFLKCAALAGFTPVSRVDLERTRTLKADLLSLPVAIEWDKLDSRWIEKLLRSEYRSRDGSMGRQLDTRLSDLGDYVLMMKRGVALERRTSSLAEKLDSLQSQWLLKIGSLSKYMFLKLAASLKYVFHRVLVPLWHRLSEAVAAAMPSVSSWFRRSIEPRIRPVVVRGRATLDDKVWPQLRRLWQLAWPWLQERRRGLAMRLQGTQVLRQLEPQRYQYTEWLFDSVLKSRGLQSTTRNELIKRLSTAWESERQARGDPGGKSDDRALPEERAAQERQAALASGNYVERITVQHSSQVTDGSLRSLFAPADLQEPQFQEVLLAYRLLPEGLAARKPPILVRRFLNVAMKDIKLVLPASNLRGRPVDMIRCDLITVFGCMGVAWRFLETRQLYLVFLPFILLVIRATLGYRRAKIRMTSVTSSMLFDRCVDKDSGVMRMLPDEAEEQVFAECLLLYWALLLAGDEGATLQEAEAMVTETAAEMLEAVDLPRAGFRPKLAEALPRLEAWKLIESGDAERGYKALAPKDAMAQLARLAGEARAQDTKSIAKPKVAAPKKRQIQKQAESAIATVGDEAAATAPKKEVPAPAQRPPSFLQRLRQRFRLLRE
eukprot:TRINITY_DN25610_c0_g1_i1.p1 TRINITY_DN25610_c0_g1~~TRINITY_DN25610_c0_g1_i1.p1  ORF type:complete len:912 (+),score=168.62 TRINITY_DN25610_c0_g1_i1:73-2736(+)